MIQNDAVEDGRVAVSRCDLPESTVPRADGGTSVDGAVDSVSDLDIEESLRVFDETWPSTDARPEQLAGRFGRFLIVRELGRGGFGVVYLAEDPLLGRKVALKLARIEPLLRGEAWRRFTREARAASRLDHPNLVPLLEAGSIGSMSYIVSVFVPGPSLEERLRCNRGGASPRWAARVVADLAGGIEHTQDRGILHRDLKPANGVLHAPEYDDKPANPDAWDEGLCERWTPRICDFGLARLRKIEGAETRSREPCGSPSYMAAEQVELRHEQIGRAAGALAGFDPENPSWRALAGPVAAKLVHENPLLLGRWRDSYGRVGRSLFGPMLEFCYDRRQRAKPAVAEGFLYDFAARSAEPGQAADYVDLLIDADAARFEQLLVIVNTHAARAVAVDRLLKNLEAPENGDEGLAARQGRTIELERVLRGGATDCSEPFLRSAMRNRHLPNSRYGSDGFRVARTLKPKPTRG
jgi:hypothetical protein